MPLELRVSFHGSGYTLHSKAGALLQCLVHCRKEWNEREEKIFLHPHEKNDWKFQTLAIWMVISVRYSSSSMASKSELREIPAKKSAKDSHLRGVSLLEIS